jgi:hypothetical protein
MRTVVSPCYLMATIFALVFCLLGIAPQAAAQTGGQGALEGLVIDTQGAVIPNAQVTATNQSSGVSSTRTASSAGAYQITPLIPGTYTLTVTAKGFETLKQENIEVNGMSITGFNAVLKVGQASETITVTDAPPQLQTTNATLGSTITNDVYQALPVLMSNQQRDPTAFATLAPGAASATRAPSMSGTGGYLSEVYLDGIPTTTANQQSDNRTISLTMPVESVDQMQVLTNNMGAEYQGAGALSFTTKSGGKEYHGVIADYIRNTAFDAWGFTQPWATKQAIVNGLATTVPAGKNGEHQNEITIALGGPFPNVGTRLPFIGDHIAALHRKLFFYGNWDEYHGRSASAPALVTIPTTLMRQGNFTELGTGTYIYNPLTNTCGSSSCTRTAFAYGGTTNVIDPSYISPISKLEQSYLPPPSLSGTTNNYLESGTGGYDNHELSFKVDYDVTEKQRVSFVYSRGVRYNAGLLGTTLPMPYATGTRNTVIPLNMIVEHQYTLSSRMVNQLKYAYTTMGGAVYAPTAGGNWASSLGIGGLPDGQASQNFPCSSFAATTLFATATANLTGCGASYSSTKTVPNAFTLVDNLQWSKGKHLLTFGIQMQWLEDNTNQGSQSTHSGIYTQAFNGLDTANYASNSTTLSSTSTGYAYASFLLGAVRTGATSVPTYTMVGGRYRPISPYVQDDWKLLPNLTLNLGFRWDYFPPYREVKDRWSFFNPNAINSLTNTAGELEFAGNWGAGYSCNCRTPVQTYWKNFGPRVGLAWSVNNKTVVRAGASVAYSRSGGVGGRVDAGTGASYLGFGSNIILPTAVSTGSTAGPSYWLNTSTAFANAGYSNNNFGGPGYTIPAALMPAASSVTLDIGNYVSSGSVVTAAGAPGYADPYLSGRAPEIIFFNAGIQRAVTKDITLSVNYAGSEAHFVSGATIPGFWSGYPDMSHVAALSSIFVGGTNIMSVAAKAANVAYATANDSSISVDSWYQAAGALSTTPTIGRWLRPYPQYSAPPSSVWANIANINYNSVQITLAQREWKGVTYTLNYTYSKNIGDDGTTRSSWAVPGSMTTSGMPMPGGNRADRDLTTNNQPQNLNIYGLGKLPFGKGSLGGNNAILRNIVGGWAMSGVFTYRSGLPILLVGSSCVQYSAGTCMPDVVPGVKIRQNGSWLKGIGGKNLAATSFINPAAFATPAKIACTQNYGSTCSSVASTSLLTKIGNAPRTQLSREGLVYPSKYNLDAGVQRTFDLPRLENAKFLFKAEASDVTNKVTPSTIGATWGSNLGQITAVTGQRLFQFSGRIQF